LKFYSRDPQPAADAPNGSDDVAVEDDASPSRTTDAD